MEVNAGVNFFAKLLFNSQDMENINKKIKNDNRKFHLYNVLGITDDMTLSFSSDPSRAVHAGFTVSYAMLQFSVYMAFMEIYLLGIDGTQATIKDKNVYYSIKRHFYDEDAVPYEKHIKDINLRHDDETNLKITTNAYKAAQKYGIEHDIKIYNATRGGILEMFERVDFDTLF